MELKKEFIEETLEKAINIFKESDVGIVDNDVKIEFVDSEKYINDAFANQYNKNLVHAGFIKDFKKEYPSFLVVYTANKQPMRKIFGLPYYISIDFDRAKKILRPYSKSKVEKYFVSVFLHELTHAFQDSVIEKHKEYYSKVLEENRNDKGLANETLAEAVSYLYGYRNVADKITKELWEPIYDRMRKKGYNLNEADIEFKKNLELF